MIASLASDNTQINLEQIKKQQQMKKLIPKGACQINEYNKYEYIHNFISHSLFHLYIIPINHSYAHFTVVKKTYQQEKYPIYELYYHPNKAFLLAAQEQSINIGCNYLISKDKKPQKNDSFIAKLRGNFSRNEFNIFDNGNNPIKDRKDPRKQFAYIKSQDNTLWNNSKRITMIVPKPRESLHYIDEIHQYEPLEFYCNNTNSNPLMKMLESNSSNVQKLQMKDLSDRGNRQKQGKGLVLETSVCTESLMITKKNQGYYQLQIGCPLTIIQGFGFLLSLIQSQLI